MKRSEHNTVSLADARTFTLADLGEDTCDNIACGFLFAWHDGHVSTVDHIADRDADGSPIHYCHACGDDDRDNPAVILPTPEA